MLKKYLVFVVVLIGAVVRVTPATASCEASTACPENVTYTSGLVVYECKCKINPIIEACKDLTGHGAVSCYVSYGTCSTGSGTSLVCGQPNNSDGDPCNVCKCVDDGTDVNETGYLQDRCHKVDKYKAKSASEIVACHEGHYLDPQNPTTGKPYCRECPSYDDVDNQSVYGTANERNSGGIESCYTPADTRITDQTGTFVATENCPYDISIAP